MTNTSTTYEYKEDTCVKAIKDFWEGSDRKLIAGNSYWVVKNPRNDALYVGNRFNEIQVNYVKDYIVPQEVYESNKEEYDKMISVENRRADSEEEYLKDLLEEAREDFEQSVCPFYKEWYKKWHGKGVEFEHITHGDYANYKILSYLTITNPHHQFQSEDLSGFTVEREDGDWED